jgi:phosphoribosylformylglycinamidine cyclo-ligase
MRPRRDLTYRVMSLPEVPEVLEFLVERVGLSARAAYSTFNMGCGFAVYCPEGAGQRVVDVATALGLPSLVGGRVEEGPRRVVLEPVDVIFESADLDLAPERG